MMLSVAKPRQYGEDIAAIRRRYVKRKDQYGAVHCGERHRHVVMFGGAGGHVTQGREKGGRQLFLG
jgi:hypothetical protein